MSTGIRFPVDLNPPDRSGYGDAFEDTRSAFEPEIGHARRRNRYTVTPRVFNVCWTMSASEAKIFDTWCHDTLEGMSRKFDIQLQDGLDALAWFTCMWLEEPIFENIAGTTRIKITGTLRSITDSFSTRASGTDELHGAAKVGPAGGAADLLVTIGLATQTTFGPSTCAGWMGAVLLRGEASIFGVTAYGAPALALQLWGAATIGVGSAQAVPSATYTYREEIWFGARKWPEGYSQDEAFERMLFHAGVRR